MCGIVGFLDRSRSSSNLALRDTVTKMANALSHRGPDDLGVWVDEISGVALGHRRLSILDLSIEGHQPMISACGRYVLIYNGEIYNFKALRSELESKAISFRSNSDTEVLLASFTVWGIKDSLSRFEGMFSFAVWDKQERVLTLARDRFGEKPLYYGWNNGIFFFGSELKSFSPHLKWNAQIDRRAIASLLQFNCIPAPQSIFQEIYKLLPGNFISISVFSREQTLNPKPYWQLSRVHHEAVSHPFYGSEKEAIDETERLLKDAISRQMISDVPLGAFLSGGIDSSAIVALMQAQSRIPVRTFTIGFQEDAYNEAQYARAVAKHLKTDHTEFVVTAKDALNVVPLLPQFFCEPFSDSSQIPTYLVAKLARKHVTVSLSGDGGDEIFGGYNRYFWIPKIWRGVSWIPHSLRSTIASQLSGLPVSIWKSLFHVLKPKQSVPLEKIGKLLDVVKSQTPMQMFDQVTSHWSNIDEVVLGVEGTNENSRAIVQGHSNFSLWMQLQDATSYLPNDILVKVDRATMAASLESRSPYLDPRIVRWVWSLPHHMRIRDGKGKWILRQVLSRYVPDQLIERPKAGFTIPIGQWLRGPLRPWAESLLSETKLRDEGYFNVRLIRQKWIEHCNEKHNWQHHLWDVLMFEQWRQDWSQAKGSYLTTLSAR